MYKVRFKNLGYEMSKIVSIPDDAVFKDLCAADSFVVDVATAIAELTSGTHILTYEITETVSAGYYIVRGRNA